MSKLEELEEKLKELKHKEFMLQMIDHWTQEDYRYDNELHQKIIKVKKEMEEIKMEDVYDDELCIYFDGEPIDTDEDVNDGVECLCCGAIFTPSYYCQEFCESCDEALTEQEKEEIRNGK